MINIQKFDIIVIGAGPAGATFTMSLMHTGLRIAVVDKASFPRDKVCGDAIPSRAVSILREVAPEVLQAFIQSEDGRVIKGCEAYSPALHCLKMSFSTLGFTSPRLVFDHHLYLGATQNRHAHFFLGKKVEAIDITEESVTVSLDRGELILQSAIIIGCDGANSMVARTLTERKVSPAHHCGALRAYYRDLRGIAPNQTVFHLLKNYLPGYFWIFPLPGGLYNVGFGMLSKDISRKGINLRNSFKKIIESEPTVQPYFANATLVGKIEGFGLPLGSLKRTIAGKRFMLTGDAAGLVDPATGEGIGNAMLSGQLAATHAKIFFEENRGEVPLFKAYQKAIYRRLGKELKTKYFIQQILSPYPQLMDHLVKIVANSPPLIRLVNKIF